MTLIHLHRFRNRSQRTTCGEKITRPATARRKEIPDGIQVCKYATMAKGREEAKANLSRKERSTLMPPSGKFQILEQQPVLLASDYSLRMILSNRAIFSAKEFLCNSREVTYQVTLFSCRNRHSSLQGNDQINNMIKTSKRFTITRYVTSTRWRILRDFISYKMRREIP